MLSNISRARLAGAWSAIIAVAFAFSIVGGAALSIGAAELWLIAWLAPPTAMLLVWRGAPPVTVAELLYAVEKPGKNSRL